MVPIEPPTLLSLLDGVKHVKGVQLWAFLIDQLHLEDTITVSRDARAVALRATCFTKMATLCSGEDVEALGEQLDHDPARVHAATQATGIFFFPNGAETHAVIPLWVILTCGKFTDDHCTAMRHHMVKVYSIAAFRE